MIETPAVSLSLSLPPPSSAPIATGVSVRCASPSWMPRALTPPSDDVAGQHRALGRAADVQLGAGDAGHRDVGAEPGQRRHRLERQLVEHHVDVQLLVVQRDAAGARPARRRRRAPGAGA